LTGKVWKKSSAKSFLLVKGAGGGRKKIRRGNGGEKRGRKSKKVGQRLFRNFLLEERPDTPSRDKIGRPRGSPK